MNLQQERIDAHCQMLKLEGLMQCYHALASEAANRDWSFLDYLEHVLAHERDARGLRSRQTLVRMAGFPAIKTLDDYDYSFAVGAPRKMLDELATLRFVERCENAVLLGPSGVGKTHLALPLAMRPRKLASRPDSSPPPISCCNLRPPGARSATTQS